MKTRAEVIAAIDASLQFAPRACREAMLAAREILAKPTHQEMVRQFHKEILDGPTAPAEPMVRHAELRAKLIIEEAIETAVALLGTEKATEALAEAADKLAKEPPAEPNLEEAIDGCIDTLYVTYGTLEDIGVDAEPFFEEVHAANMRKRDPNGAQKGSKNPVGKVIKPAGWTPPDIEGVLARVIAERVK